MDQDYWTVVHHTWLSYYLYYLAVASQEAIIQQEIAVVARIVDGGFYTLQKNNQKHKQLL